MELKIEKGVPHPNAYGQNPESRAAIWRNMSEGDSVLFETRDEAYRFCMTARADRLPGWRASQRRVEGGWRVWKLKRDPKPNSNGQQ